MKKRQQTVIEDADGAAANDNDMVGVARWSGASGVAYADSSVGATPGVIGRSISSFSPHQGVSDNTNFETADT